MGVADVRHVALPDIGPEHERQHALGRMLVVVAVLVERDDGQRALGPPGRRAHDGAQLGGQEPVTGPDPAALHVGAVVGGHPGEVRRGGRAGQVGPQRRQRRKVRRAVGGPASDVGEVGHRLVVVPVVLVHRVVAGAVRALQVRLPRLVPGADEVADVAGVDRVLGVQLQRVGERDAERAAAGQREVVGVARVLLGEEVGQDAGPRDQAVEERGLLGVAQHRAEILVFEVEEEHVLVARHVGGRWGERRRAADRGRDAEPQAVGHRPVVPHQGCVRAVVVGERCRQDQRDPGAGGARRERARGGPVGEPVVAAAVADGTAREHRPRGGEERHRHRRPARGRAAKPARQLVPRAGGHGRAGLLPQRDRLGQPGGAAGAAGEQAPAVHGRPLPGGPRQMRCAVGDHGRETAGHMPARDRDRVPALSGDRAGLRARVEQQVDAGPGHRLADRPGRSRRSGRSG